MVVLRSCPLIHHNWKPQSQCNSKSNGHYHHQYRIRQSPPSTKLASYGRRKIEIERSWERKRSDRSLPPSKADRWLIYFGHSLLERSRSGWEWGREDLSNWKYFVERCFWQERQNSYALQYILIFNFVIIFGQITLKYILFSIMTLYYFLFYKCTLWCLLLCLITW